MRMTQETAEVAEVVQKIRNSGIHSELVLNEVARVSQKVINEEPLNYLEISLLEIIRESLEFMSLNEDDEEEVYAEAY